MSRNSDNIRDITTFLMMNNCNPSKGFSAQEIADAVPHLRRATVYRILKDYPQFIQTINSVHPTKYYFDPSLVKNEANAESWQIRPELKVERKALYKWFSNAINTTKSFDDTSHLYNEIVTVGKAYNNALLFTRNEEVLQPALWEAAKYSLDNLETFAATLYQRIQHIKQDPRYNSPEWWAILTEGEENGNVPQ